MSNLHYAALDEYGQVIGVEGSVDDAIELAQDAVPGAQLQVQYLEENGLEQNAADPSIMPGIALQDCGIKPISDRALSMGIDEAYRRLRPFFVGLERKGQETRQYDNWQGMSDAWIGKNYKTGKDHPEQPSKVMGVTLVPASHPRLATTGTGPYALLRTPERQPDGLRMIERWKNELPSNLTSRFTLCRGSSPACRDSCLIFTGNNAAEIYNTYRKVAQTMALLNEPEAFARMLAESIRRFLHSKEIRSGTVPYIRLNVLSDLPWELLTPWLFDHFEDMQFYDYTKVPGRIVPDNYDLTFSVSGTNANLDWAMDEIGDRNRRIAVVFVGMKMSGGSWKPIKLRGAKLQHETPLPHEFWGLDVVDGDVSDVRPLDPSPSCVGLRWKTPSGKRSGVVVDPGKPSAFITPVYVVSPEEYGKLQRPNPGEDQWLIAPVTPRYQPIEHDASQPASI